MSRRSTAGNSVDVQRLSLFVYENSTERVMFNNEEYTCAYVEQLIEENEQLRAELIRVVEENESVKRESSQLKRILHQRNALDEEADDSCDETASPPLRSSVQRTSFSAEDEQVLTKRLEVKTSENLELTERLGQLRTERDGLASELERVRTENVRLTKDLRTSELRIVRLTKEEEEGFRLRMENSEQRDRIAQVESQRRESLILNEELESELERKKEEIADLKDKVASLISADVRTSLTLAIEMPYRELFNLILNFYSASHFAMHRSISLWHANS